MKCCRYIIIYALSLPCLCSCTGLLFGIRNPRPIADEDIRRSAFWYHIPATDLYCNKSTKLYYASVLQNKSGMHLLAKNHIQPLQAIYFDKNGKMISWHINCLAGGPMGQINWNRDHRMDIFPPITAATTDTIIDFDSFYQMLRPLYSSESSGLGDHDFFVIVYWNGFLKRGSRKLIQTIRKNLILAGTKSVKVLWVNNDNDFTNTNQMITPADQQWVENLLIRK